MLKRSPSVNPHSMPPTAPNAASASPIVPVRSAKSGSPRVTKFWQAVMDVSSLTGPNSELPNGLESKPEPHRRRFPGGDGQEIATGCHRGVRQAEWPTGSR
jgi:hypothetical protein